MRTRFKLFLLISLSLILLPSCAILSPSLEKPTITITSLSLGKSNGLKQSFNIGLSITNPNGKAIPVVGMKYTMSLNGYDLLSGVTNEIPTLEAYSDTDVTLSASANLVSALRLINSLTTSPLDKLQYSLDGKLDLKGWPLPMNVSKSGGISLQRSGTSE